MKNDFIPFCQEFARKYKNLPNGSSWSSEGGKYTIEKTNLQDAPEFFNHPASARVNTKTGKVQIDCNLDKYSKSGITFLLVWCFLRYIHKTEDSIPISSMEIDNKTIEALRDMPEFSLKEAALDLVNFALTDNSDSDFFKRINNLIK